MGDFVIDINYSKGKLFICRVEVYRCFVYKFDINLVRLFRLLVLESLFSGVFDRDLRSLDINFGKVYYMFYFFYFFIDDNLLKC